MLLKDCKELNWIEHYEILYHFRLKKLNQIIKDNHINNNSTIKIELKYNCYAIIHKSTKKDNIYQVSYFDRLGAYSDKELNNIKDCLLMFINSKILEVI